MDQTIREAITNRHQQAAPSTEWNIDQQSPVIHLHSEQSQLSPLFDLFNRGEAKKGLKADDRRPLS